MMDRKKFNLWNRLVATLMLAVSAVTYISTIEPSASFWDCGEFIASSYKLEVGHPPGNPVFQLIARFFTLFTGAQGAAVAVNVMSALCSALTIFFLYLTIVFFAKRLIRPSADGRYGTGQAVAIFGSAAVGALAYCFSDTFWFSAVEGEVYAMSSLFTALVLWAMTRWYEVADEPYANRWIVLISFLMGLSIGIHLLNLLMVPALVYLFYYRRREDKRFTFWELVKIGLLAVAILFVLVFIIIPYLPKVAAYTDLFFVNTLGLPYNSGAAFFMIALLALCFWGILRTYRQARVFLNTVLVCLTTIVIGFSVFTVVVIRSNAMTPTNEYQPDNAFTLVRYLSREQYGSTPLLYGQYFDAPMDLTRSKYWAPLDGKYKHVDGPLDAAYDASGKMLFPRMWNGGDAKYIKFYESYMNGKGITVPGAEHKKPTFGTNLRFFFDYQLGWMYWRYFMWNFAGRQNDVHSPSPGDIFYGNWESGIRFLDEIRLGDQCNAPEPLAGNKGKNHYYLLPLLLGLIGLFFQFDRDKRGCWITFLVFFMTGIAVVIYLNQPPYQVRERDYAYAGSFYAFSIWIGLAVLALYEIRAGRPGGRKATVTAVALTAAGLCVPALMACQNWDDHDRSHRKTAVEMARNYLNSAGEQGILVTHGDNDTFPLWYAQEVEGVRTDVRICNTSLLGTDWHIGQMKWACNESRPLDISVGPQQYLYGTNDMVRIYDTRDQVIPLTEVMKVFRHPDAKLMTQDGRKVDYIVSRRFSIPVDKENVLRYGILDEKFADRIPDEIVLEIPKGKDYISKPELFMLDLLSNYRWDRPIHMLSGGGDINMGIKDYLMYEGYTSKFVPLKTRQGSSSPGLVDTDDLYDKVMNVYSWKDIKRDDYFIDYQNLYTFLGVVPQRDIFVNTANALLDQADTTRAVQVLEKCLSDFPDTLYPYDAICIGFSHNDVSTLDLVESLYRAGQAEAARTVAERFRQELMQDARFYLDFYDYARSDFDLSCQVLFYLADTMGKYGDKDRKDALEDALHAMIDTAAPPEGS